MRWWKGAILGLAGVAYARGMVRRNRGLAPPPVCDASGRPLPTHPVRLTDGETVGVVDAGRGPAVLWVPGADGVKETFRYQLPAFSRRYRVVAPDLREGIGPAHTFDRFARDLAEVLEARGAGPAVVVGQSLGGAIAMHFAFRFPELTRGLVLCNTLSRVRYDHVGFNRTALVPVAMGTTRYLPTALARAAARLWSRHAVWIYDDGPASDNLVDYALFTGPRTVPPRISARRVNLLKATDLRSELAGIRAPTLVVKGPRDAYCPPEWSLGIAEAIPGARYLEIPGTGHCSHISAPGAFNAAVMAWLDEVSGEAGARAAPAEPSERTGARAPAARPGEGGDA